MTDRPTRPARKLLVIGWDAADWDVAQPLMDAGAMPALKSLVDRGVSGNLATLDPPFSPMLWTSIATGKTADKHGILGFTQPLEDGSGIRPVLGSSRTAKAIWNIANQNGLRSNVIGWWPSHPAEPIDGVMASNFFHRVSGQAWAQEPPAAGSVHPPELADVLGPLRVHPAEITQAMLAPFVPSYARTGTDGISENEQRGLDAIARMIAEAASTHAAATWAMEHTEWDLMAVYLDTIDHFGHSFMKFRAPQQAHVPDDVFERFRECTDAAYRFHDMMLERLLALAGPETTVVLLSDHGFHSGRGRLRELPKEPAGPAAEHRDFGVFVAAGPGVRQDDHVYGASLLDVAPTLLTLLGLPVGQDMDGRVLTPLFETPPDVVYIPSWEAVDGPDGRLSAEARNNPWTDQAALDQLVELGYIDAPEGDMEQAVTTSVQESSYYLARVYLSKGMPAEARPLLEGVWAENTAERYGLALLRCYEALRLADDAFAVLDTLEAQSQADYRAERDRRIAEGVEGAADLPETVPTPTADLQRGRLLMIRADDARGDVPRALELLERAAAAEAADPAFLRSLGFVYQKTGRWAEAEAAFRRALALDPDQPDALRPLAHVLLAQNRDADALDAALESVGLRFFDPAAHFALGRALTRTGQPAQAAQAFEVAIAQRPSLSAARFALAELYRDVLDRPLDATRVLTGMAPASEIRSVPQRPEDRAVNRPHA